MTERLECEMCGDDASELRWTSQSNSRGKPSNPECEECYRSQTIGGDDSDGFPAACGYIDGPGFDDLPLAQKAAPVRVRTIER